MNVVKKVTCKGWLWLSGVAALLIVLGCLIGCGTARGVITGLEATGAGILQDFRGAVDGIDRADESGGGE